MLSSPSSSSACTDEAKALAFQVQRVDSAFTGFHTDLMKLRAERDAATVKKADAMLKLIRQAATKAIHATATAPCVKKQDDNDENDNEDENDNDDQNGNNNEQTGDNSNDDHDKSQVQATVTTLSVVAETSNDEENDGRGQKLDVTFSGDATAIADQAIAAMQVAFDTAKNAPASTSKPSHRAEPTKGPKVDSKDQKGEHHD